MILKTQGSPGGVENSNRLAYLIHEHTLPTHAIENSLAPRMPHRCHGCKSDLIKLVLGHSQNWHQENPQAARLPGDRQLLPSRLRPWGAAEVCPHRSRVGSHWKIDKGVEIKRQSLVFIWAWGEQMEKMRGKRVFIWDAWFWGGGKYEIF